MGSARADLNLDLPISLVKYGPTQVYYHGISGGNMARLHAGLHQVGFIQPHAVILDIGGNDLCDPAVDPLSLAVDIVKAAAVLISDIGVKIVVVMPLFKRDRTRVRPQWRSRMRSDYNNMVEVVNARLVLLCASTPGVHMWRRSGMTADWELLLKDGVHFNTRGHEKYFRNVRGATQLAVRCLHAEAHK